MRNQTAQGSTTSPAPAKKTRATKVAEALRRSILRGEMEPGAKISLDQLLKTFWESHDPTQGMRQGNDRGTQYRSGIYVFNEEQRKAAEASRGFYQQVLAKNGYGRITTEILDAPEFYYAEDYHQQYLAKNPNGYCGLGGTGVCLD